ncbi:succinylglutamate-semialdehyde dehydrogenase [Halomonas urumqiensis]|uniref:N-succinylglutamate 5-semialdehyde dehydrogenase n=1 Tax=Halomonas urumqiensis TaxID=1684789 RepID=A0A2N7UMU0_9GAMM|nr:succinylglutamate-semialdehyde dehydrogenase [Halomonas urumqiensis]PMR81719.1 succinylglutamate-semialdehyde dehydrogenase [Halomonas urumqiensis]PTB02356.1 succinylglutamate-semialdehyde dehydrogenase [Halomonas urumqiensis]GHE21835.1 N-succinylglutamate 5-semialdehyde dehydrogenase [Halomonas urumqiensis]
MHAKQQHVIDGQWVDGDAPSFTKHDSVYGHALWTGNAADDAQVTAAVAAARGAFPAWARTSFAERQALVERFREVLERHREDLAHAIAGETGKPLWEARTEVGAMIGKVALSIRAYQERTGECERDLGDARAVLRHRPHGVLAVFGPYNFPGHLPNGHMLPALLAGNTVVFKPSEQTPLTADLTLQCWQEAGLPKGVINLVQGAATVGQALAASPDIDGLLFTGSAKVGGMLHRQFAGQLDKILALELGGNNPLVIKDVPDQEAAVLTILQSAFLSGGQRCTCARRLIVPEGQVGDHLLDALSDAISRLHLAGQFAEPAPFYAGLVSVAAADGLLKAQEDLEALGGTVISRMERLAAGTSLLSPALIDVTGLAVPDEEHFGPLLKVHRYADWDEAIRLANDTRYGLSAGLIGGERADWDDFLLRIRAGIVNWNRQTTGASGDAPFGGVGDSGNHRPSAYYAADYCAYPVASVEAEALSLPDNLPPGVSL